MFAQISKTVQRRPHHTDSPDCTCSDVAPVPSPPPADAHKALPRLLGDAGNRSHWQTVQARHSQQKEKPTERTGARAKPLKSQMCRYFKTEVGCRFGDQCAFAHGTGEWRPAPDLAKRWIPKTISEEESREAPDLAESSSCKTIAKEESQGAPDPAGKWAPCKNVAKKERKRAADLAKKWVPKTVAREDASKSATRSTRRPQHQSAPDEDEWEWEEDWDFSLYVKAKDGVDGSTVRAEFTGSELRDRDLPDVFDYLEQELWKVCERSGHDYKLDIDFSVNKGITDTGVADHLVPFLDQWPNCHRLKLYKTSCSEEAIRVLIPWVSLGYARELHLSDMGGQVSGQTILELLRQVHRGGNFPYLNYDEVQCALWLRLEHNGIPSEEVVKTAKKEGLSFRVLEKSDLFHVRPGVPTWSRKGKAEAVHLVLFHVQDIRVKRKAFSAVAKAEAQDRPKSSEERDAGDTAVAEAEAQDRPKSSEEGDAGDTAVAEAEAQDRPKSSEEGDVGDTAVAEAEAQDRPKSSEEGDAGDTAVAEAKARLCTTIAKVESERDLAKASLCRAIAERLQAASDLPRPFLCETIAEEPQEAPDPARTSLCEAIAREIEARRRTVGQARRAGYSAQHQTGKATAPAQPLGHKGQGKGLGSLADMLRNIPLPKQDVSAEPSGVEKFEEASTTGTLSDIETTTSS